MFATYKKERQSARNKVSIYLLYETRMRMSTCSIGVGSEVKKKDDTKTKSRKQIAAPRRAAPLRINVLDVNEVKRFVHVEIQTYFVRSIHPVFPRKVKKIQFFFHNSADCRRGPTQLIAGN